MPEDLGPSTDQPMPTSIAPAPEGLAPQQQTSVEREPEPAAVPEHLNGDAEVEGEEAESAAVPATASSVTNVHQEAEESETAEEDAADEEPAEPATRSAPQASLPEEAPKANNKRWYVVKVQSGREESIKEAIE